MADKKLAAGLKMVRSRPMYFALVLKAGKPGGLVVSKSKVTNPEIDEVKDRCGGAAVVKGVCSFKDGQHVFATPKASTAWATGTKLLAKAEAGISIDAVFTKGGDPDTIDIPDGPPEDAEALRKRFEAQLKESRPAYEKVANGASAEAKAAKDLYRTAVGLAKDGDVAGAIDTLDDFDIAANAVLSAAPVVAPGQAAWEAALLKAKPAIQAGLQDGPGDWKPEFARKLSAAQALARGGDFPAATVALHVALDVAAGSPQKAAAARGAEVLRGLLPQMARVTELGLAGAADFDRRCRAAAEQRKTDPAAALPVLTALKEEADKLLADAPTGPGGPAVQKAEYEAALAAIAPGLRVLATGGGDVSKLRAALEMAQHKAADKDYEAALKLLAAVKKSLPAAGPGGPGIDNRKGTAAAHERRQALVQKAADLERQVAAWDGRATAEELKALRDKIQAGESATTAGTLDAADLALGEVETGLPLLQKAVENREAARKVEADTGKLLDALTVPADANATERDAITKAIQDVRDALKAAMTPDAAKAAGDRMAEVDAAVGAVQKRLDKAAADLLATVAKGQPLTLAPEGATPQQQGRLTTAVGAVRTPLGKTPMTEQLLTEARDAAAKLKEVQKAVADEVDALGGAEGVKALADAKVSGGYIETLVKAFGPDVAGLKTLVADLGGAATLKTLTGKFTGPDLKKLADNLGGGKAVATLLADGCDNNATTLFNLQKEFGGNFAPLKKLQDQGGLGKSPKALAALFKTGCDGDPAKLKQLCESYTTDADLANLSALAGTFGDTPAAMGTLMKAGCEGDPAKLKALGTAFPAPDAEKLKAGDPAAKKAAADLANLKGLLTTGGLDAKPAALAELIKTGMGGDFGKLNAFTAAYPAPDDDKLTADDPAAKKAAADLGKLKTLLASGGLGDKPKALAAAFTTGCDGDPAKFKAVTDGFDQPADVANLKGLLTTGGLGDKPEVFGHALKTGCDGDAAKLKKLGTTFNDATKLGKLNSLVTAGGMGGGVGENAATLGHVLKTGLGGEPARLIALHDGFGGPGKPPLSGLKQTIDAFGVTAGGVDPATAGERLERVLGHVKPAGAGPLPPAVDTRAAARLGDPFYKLIKDQAALLGATVQGPTPPAAVPVPASAMATADLLRNAATFKVGAPLAAVPGHPPDTAANLKLAAEGAATTADDLGKKAKTAANGNADATTAGAETEKAAAAATAAAAKAADTQAKTTTAVQRANVIGGNFAVWTNKAKNGTLLERNQVQAQSVTLKNAIADQRAEMEALKTKAGEARTAAAAARAAADAAAVSVSGTPAATAAEAAAKAAEAAAAAAAAAVRGAGARVVGVIDMAHFCGRHTRGGFTFASNVLAGENPTRAKLMTDTTSGLTNKKIKAKRKQGKKDAKKTTLFAETVTATDVAAYVNEAIDVLIADGRMPTVAGAVDAMATAVLTNKTPDPFQSFIVDLPKAGYQVKIGFKVNLANGKLDVTQFFPKAAVAPNTLETVQFFDMHAVKKALTV